MVINGMFDCLQVYAGTDIVVNSVFDLLLV